MTAVEYGDKRLPVRFWSKVDPDGPVPDGRPDLGPCWIWTATLNPDGYGRIRFGTRAPLAHRALWELTQGPLVYPQELDHLCRVRHCVNIRHLEQVEHAENVRRGKGGENWSSKTNCPQGHPYDEVNTRLNSKGSRVCRTCATDKATKYRLSNPERSREAVRRSREKHKEARAAGEREYRERNRDVINERKRAARAAKREGLK